MSKTTRRFDRCETLYVWDRCIMVRILFVHMLHIGLIKTIIACVVCVLKQTCK